MIYEYAIYYIYPKLSDSLCPNDHGNTLAVQDHTLCWKPPLRRGRFGKKQVEGPKSRYTFPSIVIQIQAYRDHANAL